MNKHHFYPLRQRAQRGMAMVEALMAVLILAIGLVGTLGLQMHSQKALNEAALRSEATIAANELIGVMNADFKNVQKYALAAKAAPSASLAAWHEALLKQLPGASATVGVAEDAENGYTEVEIEIQWQRDAASTPNVHRIVTYLTRAA